MYLPDNNYLPRGRMSLLKSKEFDDNEQHVRGKDREMKKAEAKWTGGLQFVGRADSGHAIVMEAGKENGGEDGGPRPGELPLIALAGCTGIDVVMILKKMKIAPDAIFVSVEAESVDEHPKIWKTIKMHYRITGDLPEKKVKKAIELSHEKYCSVGAILGATADLRYDYEILPSTQDT